MYNVGLHIQVKEITILVDKFTWKRVDERCLVMRQSHLEGIGHSSPVSKSWLIGLMKFAQRFLSGGMN